MIFSGSLFLVYFLPLMLLIYYATPARFRNYVLLISSIFFYSWGAPRFILVILATTIVDFLLVKKMDQSEDRFQRRLLLTVSVCINMGLLFYFKYSNFFIENLNLLFHAAGWKTISWMKLALPIGISFYTFETITYVVDVYRKVHKPQPDFLKYQLYIIFYPKLIAGPIIRYHEFADQITNRFYSDTMNNRLAGFTRFCLGLSKKVMLANPCGEIADQIIGGQVEGISSGTAWLGILAYALQIYFDFSGYSDMAIGLGRMMGFKIPENFNSPYTSGSITEFWRRWHITLGSWMRNYLYIPLGGNRVESTGRLYFNLILVFLLSGLWHGASWNFIFWGAYHGVFLVLERAFLLKVYKKISLLILIPLNFLVVIVGWVFFRIESFSDAISYLNRMFLCQSGTVFQLHTDQIFYLLTGLIFSVVVITKAGKAAEEYFYQPAFKTKRQKAMLFAMSVILFSMSLGVVSSFGFNPFIYFRF